MTVWFVMKPASAFLLYIFLFFFFLFLQPAIVDFVNCEQCIHALFTVPRNFFIKNGSHSTIYAFKNYFATVFSVSTKISSIQIHPVSPLSIIIKAIKWRSKKVVLSFSKKREWCYQRLLRYQAINRFFF